MDSSEEKEEKVTRVVKGGATAFPTMVPKPAPVHSLASQFREFLLFGTRESLYATLVVFALKGKFQDLVQWYLKTYNGTEEGFFAVAGTMIHFVMYFGNFTFFEILERFKLLRRYKLARSPIQEPPFSMKLRTMAEFTVGNILIATQLKTAYGLLQRFGTPKVSDPLPSFGKVFLNFMAAYYMNVVGFGLMHRLVHHGPLYRAIHRKHHQYVGSVSVAAEHAHPIEGVLANTIPTLAGCVVTHAHPQVLFTWLALRMHETYEAHSGYSFYGSLPHKFGFTFAEAAAYHDAHHSLNKGNFSNEFMDGLMGTQDKWNSMGGLEGYIAMSRKQRAEEGYP